MFVCATFEWISNFCVGLNFLQLMLKLIEGLSRPIPSNLVHATLMLKISLSLRLCGTFQMNGQNL